MSASLQKSRFTGVAGADLPTLLTRADVARFLGIELRLLVWWVWVIAEHRRYYEFEIERSNGGAPRLIRAPIKPIKDLQRALLPLLEMAYAPKPHVHGFVRGRGPTSNAAVHRNQRWILRVDLKDFFPSIHFGRVRGLFRSHPFDYPDDPATLLAQICCHRGELPQGAPTSPLLSNLICRSMDKQLARFANALHCHYSRYADDICFSSGRRTFPSELATLVDGAVVLSPELRAIITRNGFEINEDKTRLLPRRQRQRVTGIVVNARLNVPREYTRHLRAVLHIWVKYGEVDARAAFERAVGPRNWPPGKPEPEFRLVIRGQLQHLGFVRGYDRVYQRLASALATCDSSFRPTAPRVPERGEVQYGTEGPSDVQHLSAAVRAFRGSDEFTQLDLRHISHMPPRSDGQLWNWLQAQKDVSSTVPRVGLFDCDSKYSHKIGRSGWKHLGNGVVAVALAPPEWHTPGAPFCIEMLYPREVLALRDSQGRRIFLRDEFDDAGRSADGQYRMAYPQKTTLVVEKVHPVDDEEKSVALGKVAFAEAVWLAQPPYENVPFDGFRPTLERMWRAVAYAQQWCA